jgi:hypothetical protein
MNFFYDARFASRRTVAAHAQCIDAARVEGACIKSNKKFHYHCQSDEFGTVRVRDGKNTGCWLLQTTENDKGRK